MGKFAFTDSANKSTLSFQYDTNIPSMQPQNAVLDVGQWRGPTGCAPKVNTNGIPRAVSRKRR
jgi:hypothetical protein